MITTEYEISAYQLSTYLFANSTLASQLMEWNSHFQSPPPHWVINFIPKAYLRRGWHLAESIVEYLRINGLNLDGAESLTAPWIVEYEPIGFKPCMVGQSTTEADKKTPDVASDVQTIGNKRRWGMKGRHPSVFWEQKEGWELGGRDTLFQVG